MRVGGQVQTTNLIIRAAWNGRVHDAMVHGGTAADGIPSSVEALSADARDLVDSMLFVDEAGFETPIRGSSAFAERFAAQGPRDGKGRSLRQLDLTRRLMRYPCSYLIYSPMFDALPELVKRMVYDRPRADARHRRAIVEILRETKAALPPSFAGKLKRYC